MTLPLRIIGANESVFQLVLHQDEPFTLDLTELGIPETAQILRVYYTAVGEEDHAPLFPMQSLQSQPEPPFIPRKTVIYPRAINVPAPESSRLNVLVAWLPVSEPDRGRSLLVEAFDSYTRSSFEPPSYNSCIIPANAAMENVLEGLMVDWLRQCGISKDPLDNFLDAATYAHRLKVLMPVLARSIGAPTLPSAILGHLNQLRGLRNTIAHGDSPKEAISKNTAADLMCAAFFGVAYVRALGDLLASSVSTPVGPVPDIPTRADR